MALCAAGPRQRAELEPFADENGGTFEILPDGQFSEQGTGVRVALLVADKPEPITGGRVTLAAPEPAPTLPANWGRSSILPKAGEPQAPAKGQLSLL